MGNAGPRFPGAFMISFLLVLFFFIIIDLCLTHGLNFHAWSSRTRLFGAFYNAISIDSHASHVLRCNCTTLFALRCSVQSGDLFLRVCDLLFQAVYKRGNTSWFCVKLFVF